MRSALFQNLTNAHLGVVRVDHTVHPRPRPRIVPPRTEPPGAVRAVVVRVALAGHDPTRCPSGVGIVAIARVEVTDLPGGGVGWDG